MDENYEIDKLDLLILQALLKDARASFLELSKNLNVSSGTIHVRVEKLKRLGIIEGSKININEKKLGFDVCCFIGIILKSAKDNQRVIEQLSTFSEVVEAYYTTGIYSFFIKVVTRNIEELYLFLSSKLQALPEIQSTETIISMKNLIKRDIALSL